MRPLLKQKLGKTATPAKPVYSSRAKNSDVRAREYLKPAEVEAILKAAGRLGEYPNRDRTMILLAYTHGLRASEVCGLAWSQVDLAEKVLQVQRCKGSVSTPHPLLKEEVKALAILQRQRRGDYVFESERGTHIGRNAFYRILQRAGQAAGLGELNLHPHMLRHACGYKLANEGRDLRLIQAYLGHRNVQNTTRYTEINPERFKGLF